MRISADGSALFFIDAAPHSDEEIYVPYYNRADESIIGLEPEDEVKPVDLS